MCAFEGGAASLPLEGAVEDWPAPCLSAAILYAWDPFCISKLTSSYLYSIPASL